MRTLDIYRFYVYMFVSVYFTRYRRPRAVVARVWFDIVGPFYVASRFDRTRCPSVSPLSDARDRLSRRRR